MSYTRHTRAVYSSVLVLSLAFGLLASSGVQAEFFGLSTGRLANIDVSAPQRSVELGVVSGELDGADYDTKGVRFNYTLRSDLQLYADVGQVSVGSTDEISLGGGAVFSLGKVFEFAKAAALKGSIHQTKMSEYLGDRDVTNCTGPLASPDGFGNLIFLEGPCSTTSTRGASRTTTVRAMSLEFLLSGNPLPGIGFQGHAASWYANVGLQTFSGVDLDTELGVGVGLVLPISQGEVYAGLDMIDKPLLGIGFRYYLQ